MDGPASTGVALFFALVVSFSGCLLQPTQPSSSSDATGTPSVPGPSSPTGSATPSTSPRIDSAEFWLLEINGQVKGTGWSSGSVACGRPGNDYAKVDLDGRTVWIVDRNLGGGPDSWRMLLWNHVNVEDPSDSCNLPSLIHIDEQEADVGWQWKGKEYWWHVVDEVDLYVDSTALPPGKNRTQQVDFYRDGANYGLQFYGQIYLHNRGNAPAWTLKFVESEAELPDDLEGGFWQLGA